MADDTPDARARRDEEVRSGNAGPSQTQRPTIIAYRIGPPELPLVPAERTRTWMNESRDRFANRCLPMLLANQAGWCVLNSHTFTAVWDGGEGTAAVTLDFGTGAPPYPAVSNFGHGIITWPIPYLFRTPPGWNLLARGPSNSPKDGVTALEGIVETDWAVATFTMNWQLTRPGLPVTFEEDEAICMVVPQRRGELESFMPEVWDLDADPVLRRAHEGWATSRARFMAGRDDSDGKALELGWQRDYFQGVAPGQVRAPTHETKLPVRAFDDRDPGKSGADHSPR